MGRNVTEPSDKDIKEQVRLAICRLMQDSLQFNDAQNHPVEIKLTIEEEIMEDAALVLDYLNLVSMKNE